MSLDLNELQILGLEHATRGLITVFIIKSDRDVRRRRSNSSDARGKKRSQVSGMAKLL